LDAIRNIFAYNLSSSGYRQIIGSKVQFSTSSGGRDDFLPRITYQNRLDRLKVFSGVPRLNGGNGLTAKYYNFNQVFENTVGIFSGTPLSQDNFWEYGNFEYSNKITPAAVDVNGGVEWSGYFIPTQSGVHRFRVTTSALMTLEFETEGYTSGIGTYTEHSRIGLSSTFVGSGVENSNVITLATPSNTNFIGIGQSVSNATGIHTGTVVASYIRTSGDITLTPPSGQANAVYAAITSENIVFSKAIGQDTEIFHTTYALEAQRKYNIRARYYIPQSFDAIGVVRNITFFIGYPTNETSTSWRYNNLYSSNYDFSDAAKGQINTFLDNSIFSGGGTLGSVSSSAGYLKIKSTKKIDIKYAPKTSLVAITKATISATTTNGTRIISISDTSGIEIGNFIFGTGIPENTVVNDIVINSYIITNNASTASGSTTLTFIDHRGFVKRGVGSISGTTLTLSSGNTTDLKSKMVVIGDTVTQYTGITTSGDPVAVTVSPSQTVGAGTTLYFYQSRGLIDEGLAAFCVPAVTRCMFTSTPTDSGATVLNIVDTTGVALGMRVLGAQFGVGTTVSSFTPTSITIGTINNTGTIAGIASGGNFTVTSTPANEGDRSLCCPPTDTSPPFSPTEKGLETSTNYPNLKINAGNVKFDSLTATVSGGNITNTNIDGSDASTKRIQIQTASGLFNILCA
jgi:peroxiredoxin family protein